MIISIFLDVDTSATLPQFILVFTFLVGVVKIIEWSLTKHSEVDTSCPQPFGLSDCGRFKAQLDVPHAFSVSSPIFFYWIVVRSTVRGL